VSEQSFLALDLVVLAIPKFIFLGGAKKTVCVFCLREKK